MQKLREIETARRLDEGRLNFVLREDPIKDPEAVIGRTKCGMPRQVVQIEPKVQENHDEGANGFLMEFYEKFSRNVRGHERIV